MTMNTRPHACPTKYFFNEFDKKITTGEALGHTRQWKRVCVVPQSPNAVKRSQSLEHFEYTESMQKQILLNQKL